MRSTLQAQETGGDGARRGGRPRVSTSRLAYPAGREPSDRRHADRPTPRSARCGSSPPQRPRRCPGGVASRARPSGRRRRSSLRSACRRSIARPATSATATPSRSTSTRRVFRGRPRLRPLHHALLRDSRTRHDNGRRTMRRNLIGCALAALALAGPAWTQTSARAARAPRPRRGSRLSDADLAGLKTRPTRRRCSAHLVRLRECGHRRRHRRVRPRRRSRWWWRPTPASTPPSSAPTSRRRSPPALTWCWRCRSTPVTSAEAFREASRLGGEARLSVERAGGLQAGHRLRRDRDRRPLPDGQAGGGRAGEALGSKGKVGSIFHDATYYVTNQRDNAFQATIEDDYPEMEILPRGISDPATGGGDRCRDAPSEPRPRRHLRHLGRAR